jgi:hypothetical protein
MMLEMFTGSLKSIRDIRLLVSERNTCENNRSPISSRRYA